MSPWTAPGATQLYRASTPRSWTCFGECDGAGWHDERALTVPDNVTLALLPTLHVELGIERFLSSRPSSHACQAWIDLPDRMRTALRLSRILSGQSPIDCCRHTRRIKWPERQLLQRLPEQAHRRSQRIIGLRLWSACSQKRTLVILLRLRSRSNTSAGTDRLYV